MVLLGDFRYTPFFKFSKSQQYVSELLAYDQETSHDFKIEWITNDLVGTSLPG